MSTVLLKSYFAKYDKDNSGHICKAEFHNLCHDLDLDPNLLKVLDADDDDCLDFGEFSRLLLSLPGFNDGTEVDIIGMTDKYPQWMDWVVWQFSYYDTQGDGHLDKAELGRFQYDYFKHYGVELSCERLDADNSGKVELGEFMIWFQKTADKLPILKSYFAKYDTDNSGHICKREFAELCKDFLIDCKDAPKVLEVLDGDDDGSLDFGEFCQFVLTLPGFKEDGNDAGIMEVIAQYPDWLDWVIWQFTYYDEDRNGHLDETEFDKLRQEFLNHFEVELSWEELDEDQDGTVKLDEFMNWLRTNQHKFQTA